MDAFSRGIPNDVLPTRLTPNKLLLILVSLDDVFLNDDVQKMFLLKVFLKSSSFILKTFVSAFSSKMSYPL